jgi:transcriptional regulator with XRE-family HTH domain
MKMNISEQLKNYRKKFELSQDGLAEIVYVSRQTISNWETGKSYPDLQSLLLLSDYFGISLDELVKGDIQMMKEKVDAEELKRYSKMMLVGFIGIMIGVVLIIKSQVMIGSISFVIASIGMFYAAVQAEKIKKKQDIQTYGEIVAYLEGKEVVRQKRLNPVLSASLKFVLSAGVTVLIIWLMRHIF